MVNASEPGDRRGTSLLAEGVRLGLVGAGAVAVWFLLVDLVLGSPLRTPGALGSAVFLGASAPSEIVVSPLTVGLYTVLHGLVFLLIGIAVSAAARAAERAPTLLLGALILFVTFEAFFIGAVAIVAQFLLGELAWWAVLGGNLAAGLAMGAVLVRDHPGAARKLTTLDISK